MEDPMGWLFNRQRAMAKEGGAFYWFNSRVISDAGNSMYGRFVYDRFLPLLAPPKQSDPNGWFVLFDGDCLGAAPRQLTSYFRAQDAALLGEVERIGAGLCYVLAVVGQGAGFPEEIDREFREAGVLGYMGMTLPRSFNQTAFWRCAETIALVVAVRIDGARFKKISYGFHSDRELQHIGFAPYIE
jgi:hypothetical protein